MQHQSSLWQQQLLRMSAQTKEHSVLFQTKATTKNVLFPLIIMFLKWHREVKKVENRSYR